MSDYLGIRYAENPIEPCASDLAFSRNEPGFVTKQVTACGQVIVLSGVALFGSQKLSGGVQLRFGTIERRKARYVVSENAIASVAARMRIEPGTEGSRSSTSRLSSEFV